MSSVSVSALGRSVKAGQCTAISRKYILFNFFFDNHYTDDQKFYSMSVI